ncbi:MAG: hypothetical protein LAP21_27380 [Acidobacteriia bacterium]|nr:hypothetical protein [Terriglobia bacterium]
MSDLRGLSTTRPSVMPVHHSVTQRATPVAPMESLADAAARLNSAANRNEAVEAVFEIGASLIGAGEAALYMVEWNLAMLRLIGSRGIGAHVLVKMGSGRIGETALSGKDYVIDTGVPLSGHATDDRLTLCIPLDYDDTPAFVFAVYGLLPHKRHLQKNDLAVVRFLKDRAAAHILRFHE